jgi:hypothetical protein
MSKYAEYDARAAEADKRIAELAARVAAMESGASSGASSGGDSDLAKENAQLKKKIVGLEKKIAGLQKAAAGGGKKKDKKKGGEKQQQKKKKGGNDKKAEEKAEKEKKMVKTSIKEGGKKGQDICGLNEMGGVRFFHLALDNAFGRWDLVEHTMAGFNLPVAEGAEERKGGAGHLGKFLMSAGETKLLLYCHVPKVAQGDATAKEWVDTVMPALGPGAKILEDKGDFIKVEAPADTDKNLFPLKMRDSAINLGFDFLKKRKLVVDAGSDDDIDYGALAEEAGVEWGAEGEDY